MRPHAACGTYLDADQHMSYRMEAYLSNTSSYPDQLTFLLRKRIKLRIYADLTSELDSRSPAWSTLNIETPMCMYM